MMTDRTVRSAAMMTRAARGFALVASTWLLGPALELGGVALARHHDGPHAATSEQDAPENQVRLVERDGFRIIDSNGLPNHAIGRFPNRGNPNEVQPQDQHYRVPVKPERAEAIRPSRIFGVALNGVIFEPGTAETWLDRPDSEWRYDALSGKLDLGMDMNHAHVQPTGRYHYHGLPEGLIKALGGDEDRMLLIGYAADGYPIYTSKGYVEADKPASGVKTLKPSYRLKKGSRPNGPGGVYDGTFTEDFEYVAGSGDLDECNGRTGVTPEYPDGTYYYALTDSFPFVSRYFRGVPDASFTQQGPPGGLAGGRPIPGGPGGFGPGPGGPPPGGPGGGRGPRASGVIGLLQDPGLAAELGLTERQTAEMRQVMGAEMRRGGRPGPGGGPGQSREQEERVFKSIAGLLEPAQVKRLEQVRHQADGPEALARPEVAAGLGLSDEQVERIRTLLSGPWSNGVEVPAAGGETPILPAFMRFHRQVEQRMNERVREVLSDSQKEKLAELLGKPFERTAGGPRPGPRGPGGPGGPGGGPGGFRPPPRP